MNPPKVSLNQSNSMTSISSVESRSPTLKTPKSRATSCRRSITKKEAVYPLQLGETQAIDLQHLFEKYLLQIDEKAVTLSNNIDEDFDEIVQELMQRKAILKQQINKWKSEKWIAINNEISNACQYEEKFIQIQKECDSVLRNDKLAEKQKQRQITNIKRFALNVNDIHFRKYNDSNELTKYINNETRLIDVTYDKKISLQRVSSYGNIETNLSNQRLSVPILTLLKPIKGRENNNNINQYKLKLKWSVSQPLIAKSFVIRCLSKHMNDDDKKQDDNKWKSLIFKIEANKDCTEFIAYDIDAVFSLDISYIFRVEYHITDPVNLLIGSNEESFVIRDIEPSANKVSLIELEYHSSKGYSYEGHPNNLLSLDKAKKYRSKHNKDFDYNEHDWIVFKVKHAVLPIRTYLPKMVLITNDAGTQALRELIISIGSKGNGNEWYKYSIIELENHSQQQKVLLKGVDWKIIMQMKSLFIKLELVRNHGESRGAQCRFKVQEFVLYGLEM